MLSRRDFLSPTKPLYGSGFSRKTWRPPTFATVKDFLRFCAAKGKGKIVEQITCDSLNSVTEWLFGGFTRVTDTETNEGDRKEVYNVSIFHHPWPQGLISSSLVGPKSLARGRSCGS